MIYDVCKQMVDYNFPHDLFFRNSLKDLTRTEVVTFHLLSLFIMWKNTRNICGLDFHIWIRIKMVPMRTVSYFQCFRKSFFISTFIVKFIPNWWTKLIYCLYNLSILLFILLFLIIELAQVPSFFKFRYYLLLS